MKTTLLHFIATVVFAIALISCQTEEVAPLRPVGWLPGDKAPNPIPTNIPPAEVIRTDYAGATKWRITFNDPKYAFKWAYQRFFSTVDGSFRNLADLNSSSKATSRADMDFLFGFIKAPENFHNYLHYDAYAPETQFKPASLSLIQLADITEYNPTLFQDEFENSPFYGTSFQPYNYELNGDESTFYENGDIFLFKTDRNPARYGAIRIIERSQIYQGIGPRIVEVIVQADNDIIQWKN